MNFMLLVGRCGGFRAKTGRSPAKKIAKTFITNILAFIFLEFVARVLISGLKIKRTNK